MTKETQGPGHLPSLCCYWSLQTFTAWHYSVVYNGCQPRQKTQM